MDNNVSCVGCLAIVGSLVGSGVASFFLSSRVYSLTGSEALTILAFIILFPVLEFIFCALVFILVMVLGLGR